MLRTLKIIVIFYLVYLLITFLFFHIHNIPVIKKISIKKPECKEIIQFEPENEYECLDVEIVVNKKSIKTSKTNDFFCTITLQTDKEKILTKKVLSADILEKIKYSNDSFVFFLGNVIPQKTRIDNNLEKIKSYLIFNFHDNIESVDAINVLIVSTSGKRSKLNVRSKNHLME